ncbi:ROK family protein [Altererythrobacter sp.]|uniref:ROK family protein n=1 Tax=Altererythrobacter sp. TaxID=1872480 RepID=UPI003D07E0A3
MSLVGAVEAGGTKFILALAQSDGSIVARHRIDTRHPRETFPEMVSWFEAQADTHGEIGAFGIGSFGPIDIDPASPTYGTFTTTPKPGWSGARYQDALSGFNVPILIDTDVNGAAIGEWRAGAGQGCSTVAYTTVGTGIGTGVVKDGVPLAGFSHYESGHLRPARKPGDDWPGACPYHGDCLEGLAAGPSVKARWGHDLSNGTAEQVEQIAGYLGEFAATLVLLHMPERLIFGGGVMKTPGLLEGLRKAARASLNGYVAAYDRDLTDLIVLPGLGDDAGVTGAVGLGLQALSGKNT